MRWRPLLGGCDHSVPKEPRQPFARIMDPLIGKENCSGPENQKKSMDRLDRLEAEMEGLKSSVSELQRRIALLQGAWKAFGHPVETSLWQRGLPVIAHGDRSRTLLPPDLSSEEEERCYQLLRRYSFRLFLRDLIQMPEGTTLAALTRYCSIKTARAYLKELANLGIVADAEGPGYRLSRRAISSFGPTLEWYVSKIFEREFLAPVLFNVRLDHTRYGGDYDLVALVCGHLVYVEIKSSPPRGVELQAVSAFINRLRDIRPHMAIFLVDTELRMKDKIVPLFAEALEANEHRRNAPVIARLVNEIFHIEHGIYLVNSRNGIYSNLRRCFRDFLQASGKTTPASLAGDKE